MRKLVFILCILGLLFMSLFFVSQKIEAETASEVQAQINNTNSQIQALDKQIAELETQIVSTSQEKNSLANLIKQLNLTRSKLITERTQTEKKITATGLVIKTINSDINIKEEKINNTKSSLAKMIGDLYKSEQTSFIEKLLSEHNFSDMSEEYSNILSINEMSRANIVDLLDQEKSLTISKNNKQTEQKNLNTLKQNLLQKESAINATKKEKDDLLVATKNKEANYQKLLAENIKKRDAFESQLSSYESKLKFILNPNLLPTAGSSVLSWPLDSIFITQLFGKTSSSGRLYASGSHSGVDFRASVGTAVKSMGTGVVIGTGDTDQYCKGASFGKWVFIKYDNGLSSTYGHLSVISSTAGQKVTAGDVVGLSGNTGHSTGPHLHVTVYASQGADVKVVPSISCSGHTFIMPIAPVSAYLDPMLYLPKLSSKLVKDTATKD